MSFFKAKKLGFLAAGVTALALFAGQGCSSDDDSQAAPSAGSSGKTGSAGKSGSGNEAGDTTSNGGTGDTGNSGNEGGAAGAAAGEAGAAGAAGTPPVDPGCLGANDCYSCAPKTNDQFLNACVEGGCPAHFDNGTLTKLNLVGTL